MITQIDTRDVISNRLDKGSVAPFELVPAVAKQYDLGDLDVKEAIWGIIDGGKVFLTADQKLNLVRRRAIQARPVGGLVGQA